MNYVIREEAFTINKPRFVGSLFPRFVVIRFIRARLSSSPKESVWLQRRSKCAMEIHS